MQRARLPSKKAGKGDIYGIGPIYGVLCILFIDDLYVLRITLLHKGGKNTVGNKTVFTPAGRRRPRLLQRRPEKERKARFMALIGVGVLFSSEEDSPVDADAVSLFSSCPASVRRACVVDIKVQSSSFLCER